MRTYVCYKRDWDEASVFDVFRSTQDELALKSVINEYEEDKLSYSYYVEVWVNRERVDWLFFNKKTMKLEPYILA